MQTRPSSPVLTTGRDIILLLLLVCGLVLLRALLMDRGGFDLHFDEAQYWEWSQQLDWGYYSKGPLVAWLIALGEAVFGHGEWQTRTAAWLCSGIFVVLMYYFARDVWQSRQAAWWAVALTLTTPLFFTLGMVITTDILMFTCWAWAMWAFWRALEWRQSRGWYEAWFAIGLGALTKLSIMLLPGLTVLLMLLKPDWRTSFRNRHVWGGVLVFLVFLVPVVGWNLANNWVTFRHSAGHVVAEGFSIMGVLGFIGKQLVVLSPLVALVGICLLWRRPAIAGRRYLWDVSAICLLFFVFKSASGQVNLNWAAPSYIGFVILLAGRIAELGKWHRWLLYTGFAMSVLLVMLIMFPLRFGIPGNEDPFKSMKQWREPIQAVAAMVPQAEFIITTNYRYAAELAYYWPHRIPVYIEGSDERRFNQHDLWPGLEREQGRSGVFIDKYPRTPPELEQAFRHCTPLEPVLARADDGELIRRFDLVYCEDYRHIDWPQPGKY
jgi:undecaprenyl-diphosphatase